MGQLNLACSFACNPLWEEFPMKTVKDVEQNTKGEKKNTFSIYL